jgi:lysophospholipase L1-like esterase
LKRALGFLVTAMKWSVALIIGVEVMSFLIVTGSNFVLYGHAREGSRAKYDPYTLFLMADGVRPTAYNPPPTPGTPEKRIWIFGGSTIRGETERDEETIPSLVSKVLNATGSPVGVCRVTNFGVNSFNSLLETKYLQKALVEELSTPHMIVFYDGANDAKYFAEHRSPYGHHGYRRVQALVESYYRSWFGLLKPLAAALYASFSRELYDKVQQVFVPIQPEDPLLRDLVDMTERRYDHVRKVAEAYGARFCLIWQPLRWVENCEVPEIVREQEKTLVGDGDRLATMRNNFSIPYLALAERLGGRPYFVSFQNVLCQRVEPAYQPDGVHLTVYGRDAVARRMAGIVSGRLLGR